MFQEVYRCEFARLDYDRSRRALLLTYLPTSADMTDQDFKLLNKYLIEFSAALNIRAFITDSRERYYIYSPEIQDWATEHTAARWVEMGVEKFAQVLARETLAELSGQELIYRGLARFPAQIKTGCFATPEEALDWVR